MSIHASSTIKPSPLQKLQEKGLVWTSSRPTEVDARLSRACLGVSEIDERLPLHGLPAGQIHEWALQNNFTNKQHTTWLPPLTILAHILAYSLGKKMLYKKNLSHPPLIIWVGKKCWPSPYLLQKTFKQTEWNWESNCLFIDPPNKEKRLWTLVQTLRSAAVLAVVGDTSGFSATASRRLQLAAEHGNTLGMMTRPPWELEGNSSAYSKWLLCSTPSKEEQLCWKLTAVRVRGSFQAVSQETAQTEYVLTWKFLNGTLSLSPSNTHRNSHQQSAAYRAA